MKITKSLQQKLEDIFRTTDYVVRYERGNFKGGYCVLESNKMIVINKFYPLESKVNTLMELLRQVEIPDEQLTPAQASLLQTARTAPVD